MAFDADPARLRARLLEVVPALPFAVTTRPMMGGHIAYADGRPFVALSVGGFGVKLAGEDHAALLARPGAARQRHGPDQPESRTYVTLGPSDLANDEVLVHWLTVAGRTAPVPRPRRSR